MRPAVPTRFLVTMLLLIAVSGCQTEDAAGVEPAAYECGETAMCGAARYADDRPQGALHVNACCPVDGPDGSLEKPYATIEAAVDAAEPGDTIAVAAGTYDAASIEVSVTLLGAGPERAAIVATGGAPAALGFDGVQGISVSGLMLSGSIDALSSPCTPPACTDLSALSIPTGIGLLLENAQDVTVSNLVAQGFEDAGVGTGVGIQVVGSTGVILDQVEASSNGRSGIVFSGSAGEITGSHVHHNGSGQNFVALKIIAGSTVVIGSTDIPLEAAGAFSEGGCVVEDNDATGVYVNGSDVILAGSMLRANLWGGAVFVDASPTAQGSGILSCHFEGNAYYGLLLEGFGAEVTSNRFGGNTDCDGTCIGPCVAIAGGEAALRPAVTVTGNLISQCTGNGILMDGAVDVMVEDNVIDNVQRWGGVWAQGGVDVSLSSNTIDAAALVGIAVMMDSEGVIVGNLVTDTWEESYYDFDTNSFIDMADGIVISKVGAAAVVHLEANEVSSSGRAGIIIDDASTDQVVFAAEPELQNSVTGSGVAAVVLQNGAETIAEAQHLVDVVGGLSGSADIITDQAFSIVPSLPTGGLSSPCFPPACTD